MLDLNKAELQNEDEIREKMKAVQKLDREIDTREAKKKVLIAEAQELIGDQDPSLFSNDNGGFTTYRSYQWEFSPAVQELLDKETAIKKERQALEKVEKAQQEQTVATTERVIYKKKTKR